MRVLEVSLEAHRADHDVVRVRVEDAVPRLALALGHVHRDIGLAHERLGRLQPARPDADADARADRPRVSRDPPLGTDGLLQPAREHAGRLDRRVAVNQDRELVTSEARDRVRAAHGSTNRVAHR